MVHRHLWELLANNVHVGGVSHHPEVLHRAEPFEAIHSELDERASATQYIDKLFGEFGSTQRPETASDATGHYHYMIIHNQIVTLIY